MNMEERIARINELYHKSQRQELSPQEKEEQALLRREYVENIRGNLKAQLNSIRVERPDKTVENLQKRLLRREVLRRRDALSEEERNRASLLMTERILGHQWFYLSKYFLGFVSFGSEIDTHPLLSEALRMGKQVYVPKVEGSRMAFYRIFSLEELNAGYGGIPEPVGDTHCFSYEECRTAGELSSVLMLMPGVAFDPYRNRIGYGKGFYDRYLEDKEELQMRTIAVGFHCQMVEQVPAEACDCRPCQVICV